jgi:hypothetical protein
VVGRVRAGISKPARDIEGPVRGRRVKTSERRRDSDSEVRERRGGVKGSRREGRGTPGMPEVLSLQILQVSSEASPIEREGYLGDFSLSSFTKRYGNSEPTENLVDMFIFTEA